MSNDWALAGLRPNSPLEIYLDPTHQTGVKPANNILDPEVQTRILNQARYGYS
jgi:hypothetical protein